MNARYHRRNPKPSAWPSRGAAVATVVAVTMFSASGCGTAAKNTEKTTLAGVRLAAAKPVARPKTAVDKLDTLRKTHAFHIDELRRLEGCGLYLCATLPTLAARLRAHRRLGKLASACNEFAKKRALYVAYALKPGKLKTAKRHKDTTKDRVVDCRLVRDGERIIRTQIVATATWQARLSADVIAAAHRYTKQGVVSAGLAERMGALANERRRVRDRLQPIFEQTGVHVPADELFAAVANAERAFRGAVAKQAGALWTAPVVKDPATEATVRRLFPAAARLNSVVFSGIAAVGLRTKRWQFYVDEEGRKVRKSKLVEVVLRRAGESLCTHRFAVLSQHLAGPRRQRAAILTITDYIRVSRCSPKPKTAPIMTPSGAAASAGYKPQT